MAYQLKRDFPERVRKAQKKLKTGRCPKCGYPIELLGYMGICPEHGVVMVRSRVCEE